MAEAYEVWDVWSGNRIASFDTEEERTAWLKALVEDQGTQALAGLCVTEEGGWVEATAGRGSESVRHRSPRRRRTAQHEQPPHHL